MSFSRDNRSDHGFTFYRQLFEAAVQPFILVDPFADRIVEANSGACKLLGRDKGSLLQLPFSKLHPGQRGALIVFTEAVLAKGSSWTDSLTPQNAAGTSLELEYAGSLVPTDDKPLLLLSITDLEDRRRRNIDAAANDYMRSGIATWQRVERVFRNIERENQLILGAAGDGIYGVNTEGKTTFVNPAAEQILGWTAEELVGNDMHETVHHSRENGSHYPHNECPIYMAFRDGAVHKIDNEVFWRKDGKSVWVEYTSTPIRDRNLLVGAVVIFRDVSERRKSEEQLRAALTEVIELRRRLEQENEYLIEEIRIETNPRGIIGRSAAIQNILRQINLVAPTDASILITGESGTGKELIARAIHEASSRKDRPLIRVNCAAIPRELFESEFFGHVKGAFTGALRDRLGRFELADGGTLFLDEIGEIPLELQGKLLRVLQEQYFERVGEEKTRSVDVRVIAATNRDLKQEVQRGSFRSDLYFRLNVFPIQSPPLRERCEDIPLLAQHFLAIKRRNVKSELRLTEADAKLLMRYEWPGNVRELQNVIERAAILAQNGRLRLDIPDQPFRAPASVMLASQSSILTEDEMRELEKRNIEAALQACNRKISGRGGTAELLRMKPTTLTSRIKVLKLKSRPA